MPVRYRGRILCSCAGAALLALGGCATGPSSTVIVRASNEGFTLGASDSAGRALFIYGDNAGVALAEAAPQRRSVRIR